MLEFAPASPRSADVFDGWNLGRVPASGNVTMEPSWAARWGLPEHPAVVKLREIAVLEQGKWRINMQPAQR